MDYAKIFGWIVLIAGLLIIGWTLMYSYSIFTGEIEVPQVFKAPGQETVGQKEGGAMTLEEQLQQQMQMAIGEQLQGMLPADSIVTLLNLVAWSILAFILIFGGGQISGLGIKLIKK
jgi:hypothetical protein